MTAADLALLAELAGPGVSAPAPGGDPAAVDALLRSPAVYGALFGGPDVDARLFASPYLVFTVLVHRVAAELERAAFVDEWLGPGRTVPVFDVAALREFLADGARRAFLAELLASFTKVASGSVWRRTPRGWRRRRYSDLDPVELAQAGALVPQRGRRLAGRPALQTRCRDRDEPAGHVARRGAEPTSASASARTSIAMDERELRRVDGIQHRRSMHIEGQWNQLHSSGLGRRSAGQPDRSARIPPPQRHGADHRHSGAQKNEIPWPASTHASTLIDQIPQLILACCPMRTPNVEMMLPLSAVTSAADAAAAALTT
jgi:hypothetical protein